MTLMTDHSDGTVGSITISFKRVANLMRLLAPLGCRQVILNRIVQRMFTRGYEKSTQ